eukprot:2441325-Pleurochrysis_carterae.AAC.3
MHAARVVQEDEVALKVAAVDAAVANLESETHVHGASIYTVTFIQPWSSAENKDEAEGEDGSTQPKVLLEMMPPVRATQQSFSHKSASDVAAPQSQRRV